MVWLPLSLRLCVGESLRQRNEDAHSGTVISVIDCSRSNLDMMIPQTPSSCQDLHLKVFLFGASGRMGQRIDRLCSVSSGQMEVVGRADRGGPHDACPAETDVIIDFSSNDGTQEATRRARAVRAALLVGTTGLTAATSTVLREASVEIPILVSPNTSLGVAVMRHLTTEAARLLGGAFTLSIREVHHTRKLDKPSGTALALADAAARGGQQIDAAQIESVREGDVVGDHALVWDGSAERITLRHEAKDRDLFAQGALVMAQWICRQKAGLYTMDDWFACWRESRS